MLFGKPVKMIGGRVGCSSSEDAVEKKTPERYSLKLPFVVDVACQ
jgi:hypothetical protein